MTEKQGGTDVRANTTTAMPAGEGYTITGHKWFMSAPMCDAFLVLAQAPGGLTCFLMPRFRPDGSVNALRFQRLKDKLGNRSNASSEVEFVAGLRVARRRGGARRAHHHRDGAAHACRLRDLLRRDDAHGAGAGAASRAPSHRVSEAPRRPADDAHAARRHGAGGRGRDRADDAALPLVRSRGERREGSGARAAADAGGEVLGLQDRARLHLRGDGVPRRQWLRRGDAAGAALSRGAGQRDLGRLRQRDVPRRAARALARGRGGARRARRSGARNAAILPGAKEAAAFIAKTLSGADGEAQARAAVERLALLAAAAALTESAPSVAEPFARARLLARRGGTFGTADLSVPEVTMLSDRALPA